jgi:hypothetical protein
MAMARTARRTRASGSFLLNAAWRFLKSFWRFLSPGSALVGPAGFSSGRGAMAALMSGMAAS